MSIYITKRIRKIVEIITNVIKSIETLITTFSLFKPKYLMNNSND